MTGTILHLADVHLGTSFSTGGLPPALGARRRQDLLEALKRALALARTERVDAVTIAGDLYDGRYALPATGAFLAGAFAALAPIPVIVAPGCTDPWGAPDALYGLTPWPENVTILPGALSAVRVSPTVTIWGAAWSADGPPDLAPVAAGDGAHLLLLHLDPTASGGDASGPPLGLTPSALRARGFTYALLGGRHVGGAWPPDDPCGCFPGTLEPLAPDEAAGDHGAALVRIAADGACTVTWQGVGRWRYASLTLDLSSCATEDEAARHIEAALKHDRVRSDPRAIATVTITGVPDGGLDLAEVRARVEARAHLTMRVELPFDYDLEGLAQERTVRGLLVRRFRASSDAAPPSDHDLRTSALSLALQALDGKGVRPSEVA